MSESRASQKLEFGKAPLLRLPSIAAMAAACVLGALVLPPLYFLIKTSLYTTEADGSFGVFTMENYVNLADGGNILGDLSNSLIFALGSAFIAICGGAFQAWIVERTDTPLRGYAFFISIISLGIPHILYTGSWLLVLGKSGPINQLFMWMSSGSAPLINVYSMTGMIVVEGMLWMPLAFLLLSSLFRNMDGAIEEAAVMSGAGVGTTFRRITLPLMLPGFLALFLLIFIRAFEAFDIPSLIGGPGDVSVLSTEIFASIRKELPSNFGQAGAFSVCLMVVVVSLLAAQRRLLRESARFQTITGKGYQPRLTRLGPWRPFATAILIVSFFILLVIPVGMIIMTSLIPFYDGFSLATLSRFSLANYRLVLANGHFRVAILNTLVYGFCVATSVTLLTAACAWMSARKVRGSFILEQLTSIPLIFPAIVLGVAFMQFFLNAPFTIYGSLISLVIAATVQYLPYGMRFAHAGAVQIHIELEEAASLAGAGSLQRFRRIVMPLLLPAILTSWLFITLLCVRGVALPILLAGPDSQVVAVMLYDLWVNGQVNELAAFGVVWTMLMVLVGMLFHVFSRRGGALTL
mgnify:CR=1 FL=1